MRFKVGDKVRVKVFEERPKHWNREGKMDDLMDKIVTIMDVIFDSYIIAGKERAWSLDESDVEPVENECIVMYRKDNQVIALDKGSGKKAIAKCSPEDEFDFYTGCKVAFERLIGGEKKLLNAKIRVLENLDDKFTKGKIYEIKDGKIKNDCGIVIPFASSFYDMEDVKEYFSKMDDWKGAFSRHFDVRGLKFVEVVE